MQKLLCSDLIVNCFIFSPFVQTCFVIIRDICLVLILLPLPLLTFIYDHIPPKNSHPKEITSLKLLSNLNSSNSTHPELIQQNIFLKNMKRLQSVPLEQKARSLATNTRSRHGSVDSYLNENLRNGANAPRKYSEREIEAAETLLQISQGRATGEEKLQISQIGVTREDVDTIMGMKTRTARDSAAGISSEQAETFSNHGEPLSDSAAPREKVQSASSAYLEKKEAQKRAKGTGKGKRNRAAPKGDNVDGPAPPTQKSKPNPKKHRKATKKPAPEDENEDKPAPPVGTSRSAKKSKMSARKRAAPKYDKAGDPARPKRKPRLILHGPKRPEGWTPNESAAGAEEGDRPVEIADEPAPSPGTPEPPKPGGGDGKEIAAAEHTKIEDPAPMEEDSEPNTKTPSPGTPEPPNPEKKNGKEIAVAEHKMTEDPAPLEEEDSKPNTKTKPNPRKRAAPKDDDEADRGSPKNKLRIFYLGQK